MHNLIERSKNLLREWKGDSYVFGRGVLGKVGPIARDFGTNAMLVCNTCLLYTSPSPRDRTRSRMPSSA